jgi:hypothetical protein
MRNGSDLDRPPCGGRLSLRIHQPRTARARIVVRGIPPHLLLHRRQFGPADDAAGAMGTIRSHGRLAHRHRRLPPSPSCAAPPC